jgi:hypothetical protein
VTATVVILSCPQDTHAHAMYEALARKGALPVVLYTTDFPQRVGLTIRPAAQGPALAFRDTKRVELDACSAVWVRRPYFGKTPEEFDAEDRAAIERECREMRQGFFDLLGPRAFWVNPLRSRSCKPTQLAVAWQCGFKVPATLFSNDPAEIRAFVRAAPGEVVYKTFSGLVPTTLVTEELLSDPELRWTPGIYQHYVDKQYELRVTVVGRRLFAVRINSQQTARGKVDWREAQRTPRGQVSDLGLAPASVLGPLRRRCLHLMRSLGLVYGAIDLVVTPEQEHVFLEVNPSGQFLWIDAAVGLPILDAMAEMLIQGRPDYDWNEDSPGMRFDAALEEMVEARQRQSMSEHVCALRSW